MCSPAVALIHTKGLRHRRNICVNFLWLYSYFYTSPSKYRNINHMFIYLLVLRCLSRGAINDSFLLVFLHVFRYRSSYDGTDTFTIWKISYFTLPERSDFHIIDNLSKAVLVFTCRMLPSLSIDEIMLPMYVNWSICMREPNPNSIGKRKQQEVLSS